MKRCTAERFIFGLTWEFCGKEYVSSWDSCHLPLCTLSQYLVTIKNWWTEVSPQKNPNQQNAYSSYLTTLHLHISGQICSPGVLCLRPVNSSAGLSRGYTGLSFRKISKTFWQGHSKRKNSENKFKWQFWKAKAPTRKSHLNYYQNWSTPNTKYYLSPSQMRICLFCPDWSQILCHQEATLCNGRSPYHLSSETLSHCLLSWQPEKNSNHH